MDGFDSGPTNQFASKLDPCGGFRVLVFGFFYFIFLFLAATNKVSCLTGGISEV
jgi:hypothetical protein